jgi:hypothetical protein
LCTQTIANKSSLNCDETDNNIPKERTFMANIIQGTGSKFPYANIFPAPILANADPGAGDNFYEVGQTWINQTANSVWILAGYDSAGVPQWTTSPASGVGVFTTVTVSGGGGPGTTTVDIVDGDLEIQNGNIELTGDLNITGTINLTGDFNIAATDIIATATNQISLTANGNIADAIVLSATAGGIDIDAVGAAGEDIDILNTGGSVRIRATESATDAVVLESTAGGVQILASGAAATEDIVITATGSSIRITATESATDSINIQSTTGGINILASGAAATEDINITATGSSVRITATESATDAINIEATLGGINILASGAAATEDINITATGSSVNVTATEDTARAIYIRANAGTSETIQLHSDQGTGVGSVNILSDVGGITFTATALASADAINLEATLGGIDADAALQINIDSAQAAVADSIRIVASAADGGIDIDAGTGGITIDSTGAFSIDGAAASNVTVTGAGIDLTLASVLGSVLVSSTEDAALAIRLHADGGVAETIQVHSDQGTSATSIDILSDVGGVTLRGGLATGDAINISSTNAAGGIDIDAGTAGFIVDSTGAFSIDGAAASNVTTTGAGIDLTLASVLGSVLVSSTEDAALAIRLYANGGTSETIQLHADQGTAVNSIDLLSDVGGVTISGGLATGDAINIVASNAAGGIDVDAGTAGISLVATGGPIVITAGTGTNGTVTISSTGTGDVVLDSDDTMLLDADGVLELNSSAGAINIGNDADAQAINIGSAGVRPIQVGNATAGTTLTLLGPANIGVTLQNSVRIMTGAGSPNGAVTAPAGSMWLRTDPAGATSRIYVNTDSGTTWTNVTCAA